MDIHHQKDHQARQSAEAAADPRVDLAVERTAFAMERTQLAWIRTVLAFISGGIAIDKGTQALHEARVLAGIALVKNGHFAGMFLSISSTCLIMITTFIYTRRKAELNRMLGLRTRFPDSAILLSIVTCILGMMAIYFLHVPW